MDERAQTRVLLIEDDELLGKSLHRRLQQDGFVCTLAVDVASAARAIEAGAYEVVISDLRLPQGSGLDLVRKLAATTPTVPVIVLTAYPSVETAIESVNLPVVAYLVKPVSYEVLCAHIAKANAYRQLTLSLAGFRRSLGTLLDAVEGADQLSRTGIPATALARTNEALGLAARLLTDSAADLQDRALAAGEEGGAIEEPLSPELLEALTQRERQILQEFRQGYRVASIARKLAISPHTVRSHLRRIFDKLEVHSQAELLEALKKPRAPRGGAGGGG